jgi:hypothetical protein
MFEPEKKGIIRRLEELLVEDSDNLQFMHPSRILFFSLKKGAWFGFFSCAEFLPLTKTGSECNNANTEGCRIYTRR